MNVFRPLISQPPSRRCARVRIPRASDPASGSVRPNAPRARPSANRSQPTLPLGVVAEQVQRQRTDRHVRLPRRGHRLVRQADLLHRGDETDRGHADPTPALGDQHAEQAQPAHLSEQVGRASFLLPPAGARGAISWRANSRHSPTSSRSDSVSEKSIPESYWTDRYTEGDDSENAAISGGERALQSWKSAVS